MELVESMKAGTVNPELAFFTATLVPSTFPVLAAARKALLAQSRDSLATRTLHAELNFNYSGSKHISEALRRFGINETRAVTIFWSGASMQLLRSWMLLGL